MAYYITEICGHKDLEDELTNLLLEYGAQGVSAEGAHFVRNSIKAGLAEIWDDEDVDESKTDILVKGYFPDADWEKTRRSMIAALEVFQAVHEENPITYQFWLLDDESWQDSWKQYYKPFKVGEHLVIKPQWEPYEKEENDIVLELDPGLAFGTGNHPTTGGALKLLEQQIKPGMKIMDLGCGTGILAVAAGLLGAKKVFAVDMDREAIQATVKNTRINGLMTKIEVLEKDITKNKISYLTDFDIIVANIIADVIVKVLPEAAKMIKSGGIFIGGGIINTKQEQVFSALKKYGFEVIEVITEGDWVTVSAIKGEWE
ncbi:MAG: 50S ribosomal protein L11 methyltransferase [Clostridiales bacterium]